MDYLQYFPFGRFPSSSYSSFKPYYKWITFNTDSETQVVTVGLGVLNLIINGLPSIQM